MPIPDYLVLLLIQVLALVPGATSSVALPVTGSASAVRVAHAPAANLPAQKLPAEGSTSVEIPRIGLNAPVVPAEVVMKDGKQTWTVPCDRSASEMHQGNNTVLFGHRDICGGVFDDLHLLEIGDPITFEGRPYEVTDTQVIVPTDISVIQDFGDQRLTMISCWPPGSISHRYVVVAKPVQAVGNDVTVNQAPASAPGAVAPAPAPVTTQPAHPSRDTAADAGAGTPETMPSRLAGLPHPVHIAV